MADTSAILSLPYIPPSQAQKHVTHNEALRLLDVMVQLAVEAFDAQVPPASPTEGEVYALGTGTSGAWAGQDGKIAAWLDGAWTFLAPRAGWIGATPTGELRVFDGSGWITPGLELQGLESLGINTTADLTNRLAVASAATLLTHAGAGHQLKINKASAGDTASLLFQSNWSGRAEMGIVGSDAFEIKVSADGSSFVTALSFAPATGHATGEAVQQSATDTTAGRLMRADYGYSRGNLLGTVSQTAGVPTGAVIERTTGANGSTVRFADGTMICTHSLSFASTATATGALFTSASQAWTFPATFAVTPTVTGAASTLTRWVAIGTTSTTSANVAVLSSVTSATAATARLMAVGRWF